MFEKISEALKTRAQKIKMIGFDVDGVLTDGSLFIGDKDEVFKRFHALDGMGIRQAMQFGIHVAIISARPSKQVHPRFEDLGVPDIHVGAEDKLGVVNSLLEKYNVNMDEFAFIGDDSVDVPVLEKAGLSATPKTHHYSVEKHIHYITEKDGGYGAAREFTDLILSCKGLIPNS